MTQRGIKQVLTERYYSWQDAKVVAENDPEVNLKSRKPYRRSSLYQKEQSLFEEQTEDSTEEKALKALPETASLPEPTPESKSAAGPTA